MKLKTILFCLLLTACKTHNINIKQQKQYKPICFSSLQTSIYVLENDQKAFADIVHNNAIHGVISCDKAENDLIIHTINTKINKKWFEFWK